MLPLFSFHPTVKLVSYGEDPIQSSRFDFPDKLTCGLTSDNTLA